MTTSTLFEWVRDSFMEGVITGLTISGGEPMEQPEGLAEWLVEIRRCLPALSVGLFSGYTPRELDEGRFNAFSTISAAAKQQLWRQIVGCLDFAVLGRYNRLQPAIEPLVTSLNQSLRILTGRHTRADFFTQCVEVSIASDGLTQITGFPVSADFAADTAL